MTKSAVIFDMDGLMFNSEDIYYASSEEAMAKRGKLYTPRLHKMIMGTSAQVSMETLIRELNLNDNWHDLMLETHIIFQKLLHSMLKPMPGLFNLLDFLEENHIPRAIATSTNRGLMQKTLSIFDLEKRFNQTITGSDVTQGKPNPEIYLKAAATLGLKAEQCLVLEDSSTGCRAAKNAGAFTVAVPAEHSKDQDFSFVDLIADTLADPRIRNCLIP